MATSASNTTTEDHLVQNVLDYIRRNSDTASLADYLVQEVSFVAKNTNIDEDYQNTWTLIFRKGCSIANIRPQSSKVDWGAVAMAILSTSRKGKTMPTSPKNNESTNSGSSMATQRKITPAEKKRVIESYASLDSNKMWRLSTGKVVEKEMEKLVEESEQEHPVHSMIMDPSDPKWRKFFDEEELQEIRGFHSPEIPELPKEMQEFISSFQNKIDLEDLYGHARTFSFHPTQEPELFWMHQSIIQALNLLFTNYLEKTRSESDLVRRVWVFLDTCFDASPEILVNSGEKTSKATSEGENKDRSLGVVDGTERKRIGTKVDLLFGTQLFELGAAEARATSDRSSTKSISELGLKCPKTLKDMLVEMERINPAKLHDIKTCGFVMSGLYLQYVIVDCPNGHVCRVTKLPDWASYPVYPTLFTAQFSFLLHLAWASKNLMESTKKTVTTITTSTQPSFTAIRPQLLKPSFVHVNPKVNAKKRKADNQSTPSSS